MQNQASSRSDDYLPFADGLRAVAILAVVAYHAAPWLVPGGFAGVDVFFVISGFLITRLIAPEIANGRFSLQRFFIRRARRLLPAALVCFVAVTAISAFVLLPDAFWYLGRSLLAAVLMYANFFYYHTAGYFSAPSMEKPLLHTWTLAVEDQFYVTWPLLLMATLARFPLRHVVAASAAILLVSLWYAQSKLAVDPDFAFYLLPTRAWELLVGAILALSAKHLVLTYRMASVAAAIGIVLILASFVWLDAGTVFPGLAALPVCLGTAAVIASGLTHVTIVSRALSLKPVVFAGLISYSLYLWHWPLIALLSYWLERSLTGLEAAGVVALSMSAAYLSWKFVERPFRTSNLQQNIAVKRAADLRFVFGCIAGVAAAVAIAGSIKIMKGVPQRYASSVRTMLQQLEASNPLRGKCDGFENVFANDEICNFGRKKLPSESYVIALFGDSMGDHWVSAVSNYATESNLPGRQVTNGGCGLLFGIRIPAETAAKESECESYQSAAKKFVDANTGLKVAVISGFWKKWLNRIESATADSGPVMRTAAAVDDRPVSPKFDSVLSETVRVFTDRGIKVLLIGEVPSFPVALPLRCLVSSIEHGTDTDACGLPKAIAAANLRNSDAALLRVVQENARVTVSLPFDYICLKERCSPAVNGTLLYRDQGHLNQMGALALRPYIAFPKLP